MDGDNNLPKIEKDRLSRGGGYALLEMEQANQDSLSHGGEQQQEEEEKEGLPARRSTTFGRKKERRSRHHEWRLSLSLVWLQGDATPGPHLPCALFARFYLSFQLALLYCIGSLKFLSLKLT
jgi:hypothetical protein